MGIAGVDVFFVLSGFIMVITTKYLNVASKMSNVSIFLYKRITRIYPPYIIYTLIVCFVALLYPGAVFSGAEYRLLHSFSLFPGEHPPILAVGWTLIHEMYFYLVFSFFLLFKRKWLTSLLIGWSGILLITNIQFLELSPLFKVVFSSLTFEFIIGALIGILYLNPIKLLMLGKKTSFLTITLIISMYICSYNLLPAMSPSHELRVMIIASLVFGHLSYLYMENKFYYFSKLVLDRFQGSNKRIAVLQSYK